MHYLVSGSPCDFAAILPLLVKHGGAKPACGEGPYILRKTPFPAVEWRDYFRPISFSMDGSLKPDLEAARPVLKELMLKSGPDISALGGIRIAVNFEERWLPVTLPHIPSIELWAQLEKKSCSVHYYGAAGAPEIPEDGWHLAEAFAESGFFQRTGEKQYAHPQGLEHRLSTMSLSVKLDRIDERHVDQMYDFLARAGTGKIFKIAWSASTPDAHARENSSRVYDIVVQRGFPAEEYKLDIQYQLLDWLGLDVARQWLEGGNKELAHWVRDLKTCQRRRAELAVLTNAQGHRFCLLSKKPLAEEELAPLEQQLGMVFDRTRYRPSMATP